MPRPDGLRQRRGLTPIASSRLNEWLDDGRDSRGEALLEMRRRLVSYFDRRNCRFATELADETLGRVGLALQETGTSTMTPPARYCYAVARTVVLEDMQRGRPGRDARADASPGLPPAAPDDLVAIREQRFACLERCLGRLTPEERELAVDYYRDEPRTATDRRKEIANRLGIGLNALSIRACRIRASLEACVEACRQE
jgi:DNA-directed RNA polymerase specialized sigma24 family protein